MSLLPRIIWENVYASNPLERRFVANRIRSHFLKMRLARRGVEIARMKCVVFL